MAAAQVRPAAPQLPRFTSSLGAFGEVESGKRESAAIPSTANQVTPVGRAKQLNFGLLVLSASLGVPIEIHPLNCPVQPSKDQLFQPIVNTLQPSRFVLRGAYTGRAKTSKL